MVKSVASVTAPYDDRVRDFLVANRIFLRWPREIDGVYRQGSKIFIHHDVVVERDATMPPGLFRSVSAYSACLTEHIPPSTVIGRHSYVAPKVRVMGINHPTDWVTTHPLAFRDYGPELAARDFGKTFRKARFSETTAKVVIGHGATVGYGALLRQGVKIGHGAIVRPGAIVTKEVAPYEIVSGVPGRSEGLRFAPRTVERLLKSAWWEFSPTDLAHLPPDEPDLFVDGIKRRERSGVITRDPINRFRLAPALEAHLAKT